MGYAHADESKGRENPMVINSHDLMPDDIIHVACVDGSSDLLVVTCVHWEAKEVTVTGYSPLWNTGDRKISFPFNRRMEIWNA
jgi:hypothetical protein